MDLRTAAVTGLVSSVVFAGGCGMSIRSPEDVTDPVQVFVADHGIHTSLVLPTSYGGLAQFSYSRFDWAALDCDQWYRSLGALMVPGPGTLGTRVFPGPQTRENVVHQFELTHCHPPVQEVYAVTVSGARCGEVLASLEARWRQNQDTAVFNERRGLRFVKDASSYSLFHNCNHEVCQWMKDLGCEVSGAGMTADVSVSATSK